MILTFWTEINEVIIFSHCVQCAGRPQMSFHLSSAWVSVTRVRQIGSLQPSQEGKELFGWCSTRKNTFKIVLVLVKVNVLQFSFCCKGKIRFPQQQFSVTLHFFWKEIGKHHRINGFGKHRGVKIAWQKAGGKSHLGKIFRKSKRNVMKNNLSIINYIFYRHFHKMQSAFILTSYYWFVLYIMYFHILVHFWKQNCRKILFVVKIDSYVFM